MPEFCSNVHVAFYLGHQRMKRWTTQADDTVPQDQASGQCETLDPDSSLQLSILFFYYTQLLPGSQVFIFKEAINLLHPHHLRSAEQCRWSEHLCKSASLKSHQPGEMPSLVVRREDK